MPMNHYAILGLTSSATAEEIKLAYSRLAVALERNAAREPEAGRRLAEIKTAYEVLSDSNKRTLYDLESMERELDASERELTSAMFDPPAATDSAAGALSFEQELAAVRAEMQQPRVAKAREKPP